MVFGSVRGQPGLLQVSVRRFRVLGVISALKL